ncbi:MAG: VWA domain-containing protein [Cyclobacteriaceae bacterium]
MPQQNTQSYAGPGDFQNVPVLNGQFNSQPRQQCAVVMDLSGSMMGEPLNQLNIGLNEFFKGVQSDVEALNRVEVMLMGFGDTYEVLREFNTLGEEEAPHISECLGGTVFCPAITYAIQECEKNRLEFKSQGITTGKPVIIFISDGQAWDSGELGAMGNQIRALMNNSKVFFQAFGVEGADMDQLNALSHEKAPARYIGDAENFAALFKKLSKSMVSKSKELSSDPIGSFQMTIS